MVEVFKAISRDGSTCYFGDKAAAAAWAGPRGRVEWERFPEPPEFGVITGGGDPLAEVFNIMGVGSKARSVGLLLTSIENMQRRIACLSAIEREFFTVPTPPDPDEDGDEPGEECLLRWNADPAEYVEQFREALPGAVARGVTPCVPCGGSGMVHGPGSSRYVSDPCAPCNGTGTVGVRATGPLQQMAAGIAALDEGHDPLCMAVLRGKACTCGVMEGESG